MILYHRGLEYYIILNDIIDYYDIIPDIEKTAKMRVELHGKTIKMIKMRDSDNRLLQSTYYDERKNDWFKDTGSRIIRINIDSIKLSDDEERLRNIIVEKVRDNIVEEGWYDVSYYE